MSKLKMQKNVTKFNFRILKKPHAYLQTMVKTPVKFQKDWPKTVGEVAGTRCILTMHCCSIKALKYNKALKSLS